MLTVSSYLFGSIKEYTVLNACTVVQAVVLANVHAMGKSKFRPSPKPLNRFR